MKHVRWTCDLCNPDGVRSDRGVVLGPNNFRGVMELFGWVRRYSYDKRKAHEWPSQHVCVQCVEEEQKQA